MVVTKMQEANRANSKFRDTFNLINTRSCINILVLQAIAVVVVYVIWTAVKYNMSDSLMLHICFCTVGYGLLMTESIILFSGDNFFGRSISRYHKVLIHGVFIGIGSILALTGISIEINARETDGWPHFQSAHAITGLVSMILMILACIGGIAAGHVKRLTKFIPIIRPIWWKICHNFTGQAAYATGLATLCLGFNTWWFELVAPWETRVVCIVIFALVASWTVLGAMITEIRYLISVFDS